MKSILTIFAILLLRPVFAQKSMLQLNTSYNRSTVKMPIAPKVVACSSILLIGVYGYSTNTRVLPSMVGVGFLYGAYHLRKEYKDDSYIPLVLAGIGCFAIQAFVVRVPQKI